MTGNDAFGANLNNFTINGVNFGSYSNTSTTALDQLFEDSTGLFGDITATGSFTFTGTTNRRAGAIRPFFCVSAEQLQPWNELDARHGHADDQAIRIVDCCSATAKRIAEG
jgi:hypothetical protein